MEGLRGYLRILGLVALICRIGGAQEYNFRYFGAPEGLTNLAVRQIYQDRIGFLWVSTENGIFRYDGERFERFGPTSGLPVTSGATFGDAPDGSLLVGGDFGLYHFVRNRFENIPIGAKAVNWAQGIQADEKGHTFIGTDAGLMEISSANLQTGFRIRTLPRVAGTSGPEAYGVLVDGDLVWYGCGLELCRSESGRTVVFGRRNGLPGRAWLVIRKDAAGNFWVRGRNAGVFELPRGQTRFERPHSPVLPDALNGVPSVDSDGRTLFPSPDGLLIHSDAGWRTVGRSAGLRGTVYAAFEDRQHSLWIGLAGRGLARWQGYREWQKYTAENGLANELVYEILPLPDSSLWVGTEGGLLRGMRDKSGAILWQKAPEVGNVPVHSVRRTESGDIWIGTETRGAGRIDSRTGHVEWLGDKQGLTAKAPYVLHIDRLQRMWAATDAGLFVAVSPYRRFSRIGELPATRFWTIAESRDGTIWAGGVGGLFGFADAAWSNYTPADGLSNSEVMSIGAGVDGKVWIGYRHGGGIDRIRRLSTGIKVEKGVQRRGTDGIVYFLGFDTLGRLWAGTERGVDVWNGAYWSHYDESDGLAWDDCNLNAFAAEADGTVWIGTSGGLSRFKPGPARSAALSPLVVLTHVGMGRTDVTGRRNPSADIRSNVLTARYSVLNAPGDSGLLFRYRLLPVNRVWTETTQRQLEFAGLRPGAYALEVEARDGDAAWSRQRAEFPFEIQTPWYLKWWFIGVCGAAPLLLFGGIVRLRILAAKKRELELVRIVEEKTIDLRRANDDLLRLSSLDPLTGLANRRVFDRTLDRECGRLRQNGPPVSLVLVDIDHFKALNDTEGHQRGDEYLMAVGGALRRMARRESDVPARYGGEEFAVILPETGAAEAARFADTLRTAIIALELPHRASPVAPVLTASIGVSTAMSRCFTTPDQLIAAADGALYRAKRSGRNRVECASREAAPERAEPVSVS